MRDLIKINTKGSLIRKTNNEVQSKRVNFLQIENMYKFLSLLRC